MDFKNTLDLHLNAIKNKEFDKFVSTVKTDEVVLIMPNGTLIREEEKFLDIHKKWFEDTDWSMETEIIKIEETSEIAHALIDVDYIDCDEKGTKIKITYYLNLIFKKCDGEWLLIHDQNTVYKQKG